MDNYYALSIRKMAHKKVKKLKEENIIDGSNELPIPYCNVF